MNQATVLSVKKEKVLILGKFIALMALASLAPLFQHQAVTGSIVNATLFVSTVLLGAKAGLLIGLIPSLIALAVGILPLVFAPMIFYFF